MNLTSIIFQTSLQIVCLIAAYLFGSLPWAVIIGKLTKKVDIRNHGSKNMGATNAVRVLGFKWGFLVFLLDAIKGTILVLIMKYNLFGLDIANLPFYVSPIWYGFAALIGHIFPIFANFRGGKGVSTCAGVMLAYSPLSFLFALIFFILATIIFRYIVISSTCATISCVTYSIVYSLVTNNMDWNFIICTIIMAIVVLSKHSANFVRLYHHTESRVNLKAFSKKGEPAFIDQSKNK